MKSEIKINLDMGNIREYIDGEIAKIKKSFEFNYAPYKVKIDDFVDDLIECVTEDNKFWESGVKEFNFSVCGGALTSVFTKKEINDFDIYFEDEKIFNLFTSILGESYATPLASSQRAITYNRSGKTFQLIKLYGTPSEIFDMFDFTINMASLAYTYKERDDRAYDLESDFVFDGRFFIDNMSKSLVFNKNTLYPINSLFRVKKYQERGYNINTLELMKIALRISQMEIKTIGDIKNQVTGLSSDIMTELTSKMAGLPDSEKVEDPITFIQDVYDGLINKETFKNDIGATVPKPRNPLDNLDLSGIMGIGSDLND